MKWNIHGRNRQETGKFIIKALKVPYAVFIYFTKVFCQCYDDILFNAFDEQSNGNHCLFVSKRIMP